MQVALITLSATLLLTGPQPGYDAKAYRVPDGCRITLIQDNDVPAQEAGVLHELQIPKLDAAGRPALDAAGNPLFEEVREGTEVSAGQVLGRIDDRMEVKQKEAAEYKLKVAKMEAENTVSVEYSEAAHKVAVAEVRQAEDANRRYIGTVPPAELNRMRLNADQAFLQIKQSNHDLNVNKESVSVREAEDEIAALQIERRLVVAPFDGVVVERYTEVGEWIRPGDPVLRIIRINRVQLEGFVDASEVLPAEIEGQEVSVSVNSGRPQPAGLNPMDRIKGRVVFASPEVEGGRFLMRAEVDNVWMPDSGSPRGGHWLLRPGLNAEVEISLRRIELPTQTARAQGPR
ncbi:MAG: HlyD family efflux transporter periplasmic adaptor subunit [Planctomycetes bacterium]|nr:HlyD family efflux transporter periplasmic adaptor subunit [Planctomycetota bacterium]